MDCNLLLQKKGRLGCIRDSPLMRYYDFQIFQTLLEVLSACKQSNDDQHHKHYQDKVNTEVVEKSGGGGSPLSEHLVSI